MIIRKVYQTEQVTQTNESVFRDRVMSRFNRLKDCKTQGQIEIQNPFWYDKNATIIRDLWRLIKFSDNE